MLKLWTLRNFKSFGKVQNLPLSSVNVFTGANSSGKSSIIQSMLLLKQTLRYGPHNRTLVLNGPIMKLGTFDDVRNNSAKGGPIAFGWKFSADIERWAHEPPAARPAWLRDATLYASARHGQIDTISGQLEWALRRTDRPTDRDDAEYRDLDRLYPSLRKGKLSCTTLDEGNVLAHSCNYAAKSGRSHASTVQYSGAAQEAARYQPKFDATSNAELLEDKPDAQIIGTYLRHFAPGMALIEFDLRAQKASTLAKFITGEPQSIVRRMGIDTMELPGAVMAAAAAWGRQEDEQFTLSADVRTVVQLRDALRKFFRPRVGTLLGRSEKAVVRNAQFQAHIEKLLLSELPEERASTFEMPRALRSAEQTLRSYWTNGVRYLGPLRDEPRPVYPVEALEDPTEVGYRGEHTAAVLDLNRLRIVNYVRPDTLETKNFTRLSGTLQEAIDVWADYMGVAARVVTRERGVFGHQLQVQTDSSKKYRDLTNVGVGVSQVLPILVMSLLAPAGSLLIFEQPELHLHPKVQARLADFFLASALTGKQCVLETHSEYMIDRFRRRIAEAAATEISELVNIFFVEREGAESRCRAVDISEYGAILDWPRDFFDQTQDEAEAIVRP